jgi:16S rRNA (guanine527-N7)-methyltransferase
MRAVRREPPLSPEEAGRLLGVSRETTARLALYLERLTQWQGTVNLVSRSTLADPWRRHILDCGQLWRLWPAGARRLVDLGSGAGLPGLVLAIMGAPETHLVESDRRKAAFLREAARAAAADVTVHACRSEAAPPLRPDVLTARGLAPLPELLALAEPLLGDGTLCLFLKGRTAAAELTAAGRQWTMRAETYPSLSDPDGRILALRQVRRE